MKETPSLIRPSVPAPGFARRSSDEPPKGRPTNGDAIIALIQEHGFSTAGELQKMVGLGWGTLHYHLHRHLRARRIESRVLERRRIYFLPGKEPDSLVVAAKRSEKLQRLLIQLLGHKEPSQAELVARSNLSQRMASYYLQKLERWGMVERRAVGNGARYLPTTVLLQAMTNVKVAPPTQGAPSVPSTETP